MQLNLDPASEARLRREIALGHSSKPEEVIARALELLDEQELWLQEDRSLIAEKLERSFAEVARGEAMDEDAARAYIEAHKKRP